MKDLIKLKSRGYEENYLKRLKRPDNSESKTYVLKVSTPYLRSGEVEGGRSSSQINRLYCRLWLHCNI